MYTYVAGWNTPGFLPDVAESLPEFDTFDAAVRYLAVEVERFWDDDYMAGDREAADARWLPVHTCLHNAVWTSDDGKHTFVARTGDGSLVLFVGPSNV